MEQSVLPSCRALSDDSLDIRDMVIASTPTKGIIPRDTPQRVGEVVKRRMDPLRLLFNDRSPAANLSVMVCDAALTSLSKTAINSPLLALSKKSMSLSM